MNIKKLMMLTIVALCTICVPNHQIKADGGTTLGIIGTALGGSALGLHAYNYFQDRRRLSVHYPVMSQGNRCCQQQQPQRYSIIGGNCCQKPACSPVYPSPQPVMPVYAPQPQIAYIPVPYPVMMPQPMQPQAPMMHEPMPMHPQPQHEVIYQEAPVRGLW